MNKSMFEFYIKQILAQIDGVGHYYKDNEDVQRALELVRNVVAENLELEWDK